MGVVEPQDATILPVVKGQRISDAVREMWLRIYPVYFELGPIAVIHEKNFTVQIQQGGEGFVFPGKMIVFHGS